MVDRNDLLHGHLGVGFFTRQWVAVEGCLYNLYRSWDGNACNFSITFSLSGRMLAVLCFHKSNFNSLFLILPTDPPFRCPWFRGESTPLWEQGWLIYVGVEEWDCHLTWNPSADVGLFQKGACIIRLPPCLINAYCVYIYIYIWSYVGQAPTILDQQNLRHKRVNEFFRWPWKQQPLPVLDTEAIQSSRPAQ